MSGDCGIAGLFVLSQGNLDCQGPDEFQGTVAKPTIIMRNDCGWELFWDLPDHFIWAWWCSFLTVLMVLWRNMGCVLPLFLSWVSEWPEASQGGTITEPRELGETSPPFLGSGQSILPLGADTDKSRRFWVPKFPKATHQLLYSMSAVRAFPWAFPCTFLALGRCWTEMLLLWPWKWCPSGTAACGDTEVTRARWQSPAGDTPSPCHVPWQTESPLLGWHLAQMLSQLSYLLWRAWGIMNFECYCVFC